MKVSYQILVSKAGYNRNRVRQTVAMPKKVTLAPHLTLRQIQEHYHKSPDLVESRRWHLLWKVGLGWTIKNSAIAVGLSYEYARRIVKRDNEQGEATVTNQHNKTRIHPTSWLSKNALLTEEQFQKLQQELKNRPRDGGIWTGPKVARWMEKETGAEKIYNQRGWDYLKKCGYSGKTPRPNHRKGERHEQQEFKVNWSLKVKTIQEQYPSAEVQVWFFDEHRVGLKPILRRIWSPIGEQATAIVHHRYEWLYIYAFVNPHSGETHFYLIPRVNVTGLNKVFEAFASDVGAGEEKVIFLTEDRAGWHRSDRVILPPGIITEYLPPYSPELQPAERLWQLTDEPLVNEYFETIDELEKVLALRCRFLQEDPQMRFEISNLTNFHWLHHA